MTVVVRGQGNAGDEQMDFQGNGSTLYDTMMADTCGYTAKPVEHTVQRVNPDIIMAFG